ncbi:MAG TPA: hypothetical protein VGC31_02375 [Paenirhodobacter sp.]
MQFRSGWWIVPLVVLNIGVLAASVSAFGFLATVAGLIMLTLMMTALGAHLTGRSGMHDIP